MNDDQFKAAQEFNTAFRWLLVYYEIDAKTSGDAKKIAEVSKTCSLARLAMSGDEFAAITHITPYLIEHGDQINADNWDALLENSFAAERKDAVAKAKEAGNAAADISKTAVETMILIKTAYTNAAPKDKEKIRLRVQVMLRTGAEYLLSIAPPDEDDE